MYMYVIGAHFIEYTNSSSAVPSAGTALVQTVQDTIAM